MSKAKSGIKQYTVGYLRVSVKDASVELPKNVQKILSKDGSLVVILKVLSNKFIVKFLQGELEELEISKETLGNGLLDVKVDTALSDRDKKVEERVRSYFEKYDKKKRNVEKAKKILHDADVDFNKFKEQNKHLFYDILLEYNGGFDDVYLQGLLSYVDDEGLTITALSDKTLLLTLTYDVDVMDMEKIVSSTDKLSEFDIMNTKLFGLLEDKGSRYGLMPHVVDWFGFDVMAITKGLKKYADKVEVVQFVDHIQSIGTGGYKQRFQLKVEAKVSFNATNSNFVMGVIQYMCTVRRTHLEGRKGITG